MPAAESLQIAIEHHGAGRLHEAEVLCRRALDIDPDDASAAHLLGLILHQTNRHAQALVLMRRSIELDPSSAVFHNNLGSILAAMGEKVQAESAFRTALSLDPDYQDATLNLANAVRERGNLVESIEMCRRALAQWPRNPHLHNALGTALQLRGQIHEALHCYAEAVAFAPDHIQARVNHTLCLLAMGDYERGWQAYESRLGQNEEPYTRRWPKPRWDGSNGLGKAILLHTEGGAGNVMQFGLTGGTGCAGGRV